ALTFGRGAPAGKCLQRVDRYGGWLALKRAREIDNTKSIVLPLSSHCAPDGRKPINHFLRSHGLHSLPPSIDVVEAQILGLVAFGKAFYGQGQRSDPARKFADKPNSCQAFYGTNCGVDPLLQ